MRAVTWCAFASAGAVTLATPAAGAAPDPPAPKAPSAAPAPAGLGGPSRAPTPPASTAPAPPALAPSASTPEPPPRPPLPPDPTERPFPLSNVDAVPWARNIELAVDFVFDSKPVSKTFALDGTQVPTQARFDPTFAYGLHASWQMHRFLRFSTYFVDARHKLDMPKSSIGVTASSTCLGKPGCVTSTVAVLQEEARVYTYNLGARLALTLPIGDRFRIWAGPGIGWGRLEYPRMHVSPRPSPRLPLPPTPGLTADANGIFEARERADSYAEVPIGFGLSYDIVPRWLALEFNLTAAYIWGQGGEASTPEQAIDTAGRRVEIGPFPLLDTSVQQMLGLALIL